MTNVTVALIFLVTATLVVVFFKPSKIKNYPSQGKTIVMFGDSLIFGKGSTEGNDLSSLLGKEIGEIILNKGVSGNTSEQGLLRVADVIKENPRVVVVLFGGNDYLHEVPVADTFNNLDLIVTKLQDAGAVVVLLGIQGGILSDPYKEEFKKLAKKRQTLYIPSVLDGLIGEEELMSDEVHPNDKGYKILAKKILPVLRKAL